MDVGALGLTNVWERGLDGVVCAELNATSLVGPALEASSRRTRSMSTTVLKAFSESPSIGAKLYDS